MMMPPSDISKLSSHTFGGAEINPCRVSENSNFKPAHSENGY